MKKKLTNLANCHVLFGRGSFCAIKGLSQRRIVLALTFSNPSRAVDSIALNIAEGSTGILNLNSGNLSASLRHLAEVVNLPFNKGQNFVDTSRRIF